MTSNPPILEGRPPSAAEERMVAIFAEIETMQLEFLDEAAKRIIELVTALLGILFAVLAFGSDFPPPYLAGNTPAKILGIGALGSYLAALLLALWGVQPRSYKHYRHNLTGMREVFDAILAQKTLWLRWAGGLFGLGAVLLTALIILVLVQA
jgi:hypothetical protein